MKYAEINILNIEADNLDVTIEYIRLFKKQDQHANIRLYFYSGEYLDINPEYTFSPCKIVTQANQYSIDSYPSK